MPYTHPLQRGLVAQRAQEFYRHHFSCADCIAAGKRQGVGRCDAGLRLFAILADEDKNPTPPSSHAAQPPPSSTSSHNPAP